MFNCSIMVVMALCACLHSSQRRNEATLTAPVTMLKCTVSIFPEKRNILGQKVLSDQELTFVNDLFVGREGQPPATPMSIKYGRIGK